MYQKEEFIKLGIRAKPGGRYVWLNALKATASYYGWDRVFPTLLELKQQTTGSQYLTDPGRRVGNYKPGYSVVICRGKSTAGWPKGLTNRFTVSANASMKDLALIAQSTQVDWEWMTGHFGERKRRSWWDEAPTP